MKRLLLIGLIVITVTLAVAAIFIGYRLSQTEPTPPSPTQAAAIEYNGGEYTALYGCFDDSQELIPCADSHDGQFCDPFSGLCDVTTEGYHLYKFSCIGNLSSCTDNLEYIGSIGYVEEEPDSVQCDSTVELNVFSERCETLEGGFEDPQCELLDYMAWYSGACTDAEINATSTPSPTTEEPATSPTSEPEPTVEVTEDPLEPEPGSQEINIGIPNTQPVCEGTDSRVNVSWQQDDLAVQGYWVLIDDDDDSTNGFWRKRIEDRTVTSTQGPNEFEPRNGFIATDTLEYGDNYRLYVSIVTATEEIVGETVNFTALDCTSSVTPTDDPSVTTTISNTPNPTVETQSGGNIACGESCDPNAAVDECDDSVASHTCVGDGQGVGFCVLDLCIADPAACEADLCTPILPKTALFEDNTVKLLFAFMLIIFGLMVYKFDLHRPISKMIWKSDVKYKLAGIDKKLRMKIKREFNDKMDDIE